MAQSMLTLDLRRLEKRLKLLGDRITRNVARRGILAGQNVIRAEARARVVSKLGGKRKGKGKGAKPGQTRGPKVRPPGGYPPGTWSTGRLKKAIGSDTKTVKGNIVGRVMVKRPKAGRNPRKYDHLVEYGVKPHRQKHGLHPGHKARPFLVPAYDTKKAESLQVTEKVIEREMKLELKKLKGVR